MLCKELRWLMHVSFYLSELLLERIGEFGKMVEEHNWTSKLHTTTLSCERKDELYSFIFFYIYDGVIDNFVSLLDMDLAVKILSAFLLHNHFKILSFFFLIEC